MPEKLIGSLQDDKGNVLYPHTSSSAVFRPNTGKVLENDLVSIFENIDKVKVERGIWNPKLAGREVAGSPVVSESAGYYYRIGNVVFLNFSITLSSKGGARGQITLTGLPFPVDSSAIPGQDYGFINTGLVGILYTTKSDTSSDKISGPVTFVAYDAQALFYQYPTDYKQQNWLKFSNFNDNEEMHLGRCTIWYKTTG